MEGLTGTIVLGSSRSDGETGAIAGLVAVKTGFEVIDLLEKNINRFDYENRFAGDDFMSVIKQIISSDVVVFATPVYWYSMSGVMKDFVDRLSDLLKFEKDLGRKLRGKRLALLSSSSGSEPPVYFAEPFKDTAAYLGMEFVGHLHSWEVDGEIGLSDEAVDEFSQSLIRRS